MFTFTAKTSNRSERSRTRENLLRENERFFITKLEQPVVLLSQSFYGNDADYKVGVEAGFAGVPEKQLIIERREGVV